jgi:UDP-N-acetylmuramyl pentapeptide phosphotransferase/UDP-N-acetylglucosamine-1-phosphate transferase
MTSLGSSSLPLPENPPPRRTVWKLGIGVLLRVSLTIALLLTAYYLIPTRVEGGDSDVPWLILELAVFGVVVGIQVPAIVKSRYPGLRAIEALALTIVLFLLIFARLYLSNSLANPATFTVPLDHNSALYFTVTVFATVGFGDITPKTGGMQLLVTVQMLLNLAVLGLVIRLLTSAAKRGVARRDQSENTNGGPGSG